MKFKQIERAVCILCILCGCSWAQAATLSPPNLVSPGDTVAPGPIVNTNRPAFTWNAVAGADGYALYISRFNGATYDLIFDSSAIGGALAGTSYVLPAAYALGDTQRYRWNMASHNASGYGTPNASRFYFTVALPLPPTISSPQLTGTTFTLSSSTQVGFNYVLEFKNSLNVASWIPLSTNSGTGGPITMSNDGATGPRRMYRVRAQ